MTRRFLVSIWAVLLLLLGVSIALVRMGNVLLATILIFSIAGFKALLVAVYYMRLKWEPRYIIWILIFGIALMVILYFTLVPDILYQYGRQAS